jgi:hypothetical protein
MYLTRRLKLVDVGRALSRYELYAALRIAIWLVCRRPA